MIPATITACIQLSLLRRPLLRVETVQDCLGKSRNEVNAMIEDGDLAFAFDIATKPGLRKEPRIFSLCVAEKTGWRNPSGQTKDLLLPEVVRMILPNRDVRSTELGQMLSCSCDHIYQLAGQLTVAKKPTANVGPNSYSVFTRDSVAAFLEKRRIV